MINKPTRRAFLKRGLAAAAVTGLASTQTAQAVAPMKRPYGAHLKLSCSAYGYRKYLSGKNKSMTILGFLEECAKLGLDAAEPTSYYFPSDLNEEYLLQFKRHAFMLGLDISGTAIGNTFTHDPGPERDKQLALCNRWVDNAAIMGAPVIRIFAGRVPKGMSENKAIANAIETTKIACEYAASKGVILALENHGGIVAKPEPMLDIIHGVDSEWFGVNFDSGNFHADDPYAELEKIAPYTVNAQIKIEMRHGGKKTPADFEKIARILADAGYRGYVALEYEGSEEPKEAIPVYIEKLRKALETV
ncbi:TIM barrel protein [bacterium]|nr:TIM barrel protein [bacterium]